jgi:hypothetical protein
VRLIFKPMEIKTQGLKELYEKDFYLWVQENLKLLKNREYDLVDWENLLEEIEDMARRELRSLISLMAVIMEHLYKWENFRYREDVGHSWISSINNARNELDTIFETYPSIRKKAAEELPTAWRIAVKRLVRWFEEDENHYLAKKYFGRFPTERDFPQECPYTFEQVMEYKPWVEEFTQQEPKEPEKNKSENKRKGFKGLEP